MTDDQQYEFGVLVTQKISSRPRFHDISDLMQKGERAMSQTNNSLLDGLKSAGNIASKKAALLKLGGQLRGASQAIGKAAYEQGMDCGTASQAATEAHVALDKANGQIVAANKAMKSAAGVKAKAVATKDLATAKAAQKMAESKVRSAHEALGDYILANNISVLGLDGEITNARKLQQEIEAMNAEVGSLGRGLLRNKVGLAAVACVVLLVGGAGLLAVSSFLGSGSESNRERQFDYEIALERPSKKTTNTAEKVAFARACVQTAGVNENQAVNMLRPKVCGPVTDWSGGENAPGEWSEKEIADVMQSLPDNEGQVFASLVAACRGQLEADSRAARSYFDQLSAQTAARSRSGRDADYEDIRGGEREHEQGRISANNGGSAIPSEADRQFNERMAEAHRRYKKNDNTIIENADKLGPEQTAEARRMATKNFEAERDAAIRQLQIENLRKQGASPQEIQSILGDR